MEPRNGMPPRSLATDTSNKAGCIMNRVIEILENNGLVSEELAERFIFNTPRKLVLKIRESIYEALVAECEDVRSGSLPICDGPFNFVASASMRGDSGCVERSCHLNKVAALSRYAALYCDRVFVPFRISQHSHGADDFDERYDFTRDVHSLLQLRPLIEAGIVILQPESLGLCSECLRRLLPSSPAVQRATEELLAENIRKFSLTWDRRDPKAFMLHGPNAYLEHGRMHYEFNKRITWVHKSKHDVIKLTKAEVQKSGILEGVFQDLERDILAQQFYSLHCGSKYLTDLAGEAEFLNKLAETRKVEHKAANLCGALSHTVPLLSDIPLSTVVRVRSEDPEAFENYRCALSERVRARSCLIVEKISAKGKLRRFTIKTFSILEIVSLQAKANAVRNSAMRKAIAKTAAVSASAVLAFGIFGRFIPNRDVWA